MAAEKAVLQADGSLCNDKKTVLHTCALRLPGIYGPNERRHIPRIVGLMRQGLFKVTYGDNPIVEFIHSKNVCQALLLAAGNLTQNTPEAAGQSYFISDGAPVNNFEFFRPLAEAVNVPFPKISLPMWLVFCVAFFIEQLYMIVHKLVDFQPLLCRAEVYKTGQTHYFSIEKARADLSYVPEYQNDMSEIVAYYRSIYQPTNNVKQTTFTSMFYNALINCILFILIASLIMSFLPMAV